MMSSDRRNFRWIGQNLKRPEDIRLVSGRGRFVDDVKLPRMAHAAVLASPHAHARIVSINLDAARALPGVYLAVGGREFADSVGPMPTLSSPPVVQHCMAVDRVRHVGEPVAAIVAASRYIAEDALALIEVDYELLPAVVDPVEAIAATGDAVLHPDRGSNVVHNSRHVWGPLDEAFASAAHVVRRRFRWPRVSPQPIETSGAVVDYDRAEKKFTVHSNMSQQSVIGARLARALGVEPFQINFHINDVGGSFGGKSSLYHVPLIAAGLARLAGRPVKYVEDRLEHMANGNQHASDRIYDAALAVAADGTFTGLCLKVIDDYGAYFMMNTGSHGNALAQATGPYRIPALEYDLTAVLTNKTQQAPYRGFGGEVGNFVLERLVDAAAQETGIDRIALRRQNFIDKAEFPYRIPNGNIYDSGDYHRVLDRALSHIDLDAWEARRVSARAEGKRIGIGVATVNERSVLSVTELWFLDDKPAFPQTSSPESVRIRINADGMAVVTIFAPHWGNSPETVAKQLTAEYLQIDPDHIAVNYASTENGLISKGPVGSRYTVMLAGAIAGATATLKTKIIRFGAHMLGVADDEVEVHDESVSVIGDPSRRQSFADIARAAHSFRLSFPGGEDFRSGLSAEHTYDHPYTTMPKADRSDLGVFYPIVGHACHIVVVEIDERTNQTRIVKYIAVHDAGTIVNPRIVEGQIRGGIAQGIGTALYEIYRYGEDGQLLTASLADYAIPTAHEIPDIVVDHVETPSPFTEFGIKGCGEGGRLACMPAVAAAIDDAFRGEGLFVAELPVTPSHLHALRSVAGPSPE
ncbi:xanthine dehydrogenase family protein molybdopterin-binding subunit [Chelatococcus sp. HY11]|uniref:xanthine dehydrogenase family protein molybdopterin-binding subunit n=2 Tax=unclassified Chelatococcus TaxID=2638111 RepID=UPI001BCE39E5|nr:xanthine dehydrogenase family protein molybdopterin-binding subunit [Chelatococcus sp. HY11]MBS7740239.1 xanthine dehydrogenase family protein molybdopterin-binding subunit [Chelatococcus sp. HY11]CAH1654342.1 CO or xanthine dehydrogenase, Mo-binding subunit [Hyphomicrobiales bacterium]CAH1685442.1 CO or xanthine dehydrogenase, Mo-binding subunit [Hyphomicrobiales bacterium]